MRQALEMALEALTYIYTETTADEDELIDKAITAIKEALAQPEQDPVAVVDANDEGYWADILPDRNVKVGQFLYTTPPQQERNFCSRCGKRLVDGSIHTCTPPLENT